MKKDFVIAPGQVSLPGVSPEWKGPILLPCLPYPHDIPSATHPKFKVDRKMSDMKDLQFIYNCEHSSEEIPF